MHDDEEDTSSDSGHSSQSVSQNGTLSTTGSGTLRDFCTLGDNTLGRSPQASTVDVGTMSRSGTVSCNDSGLVSALWQWRLHPSRNYNSTETLAEDCWLEVPPSNFLYKLKIALFMFWLKNLTKSQSQFTSSRRHYLFCKFICELCKCYRSVRAFHNSQLLHLFSFQSS